MFTIAIDTMQAFILQFCKFYQQGVQMQQITLRPDQQNLKDSIYNDWSTGIKNVLAVLSTGGGKSIIMSDIVKDVYNSGKQSVVMAHRNELISQMSVHIANRGIPHRIIGSDQTVSQITKLHREIYGQSFVNPSAITAVASVDTINARKETIAPFLLQTNYWFGDEWHHCLRTNKWGKVVDVSEDEKGQLVGLMPYAQGAGFTATPERADGQGLGREYDGVMDTIRIGLEMRELINRGALSDFEIVCPTSDLEIEDEKVSKNGDWSLQKLKASSKKSHIVGDVVKSYKRYALGKQAICFATDIESANDIANNFNANGIRAEALSSKTLTAVREKFIKDFRNGKLTVLVNVDLFDEGFDVPACEVVIMARPTASLGKYRQMAGRCLRVAEGKAFGLIMDLVSNVKRHGLPDRYIPWTLARRDKRAKQEKDPDEIELRNCLNIDCAKPYEAFYTACPYCGCAPPLPEPQDRTLKVVEGDLILLDRATLEEMRKATELETGQDFGRRCAGAAGSAAGMNMMNKQNEKISAQRDLKEAIEQWAGCEIHKGLKQREIEKKFYLIAGCDILTALSNKNRTKDFIEMTETVKGWYLKRCLK